GGERSHGCLCEEVWASGTTRRPSSGFGMRLADFSYSDRPRRGRREGPMSERNEQARDAGKIKPIDEWTTGEEAMTGAQESYLHTLAREAGEDVADELTKGEASEKIDELRQKTGRQIGEAAGQTAAKADVRWVGVLKKRAGRCDCPALFVQLAVT